MTRGLIFRLCPILGVGLALGFMAPPSSGQAPKTGTKYYVDAVDLGFRFREPKGWEFIPPQPNERNLIGKYAAPSQKGILFPNKGTYWTYTAWVVKFDRRKAEGSSKDKGTASHRGRAGAKDIDEWVQNTINKSLPGANFQTSGKGPKTLKLKGCEASEIVFNGKIGGVDLALYAAVFKLHDEVEVALVFNGPGGRKWSKYEGAFRKFARSFSPVEVEGLKEALELGGGSLRETKRAKLKAETARMPGWEMYETENYFVISNNDDRDFLDELMVRLEAIRVIYEQTYPPSLAEELNALAAAKQAKDGKKKKKRPSRTKAAEVDPMERSRTSIVRVCANRDQYHSYGGPGGSAGYWSPGDEELVIYDDQASGGRSNTWKTLNHEAFHQYCFYFFGNLSPHSWFNEGTGDFYSGYELKNRKFTLKPFDWRVSTVRELIREGQYVPLKELVRFDQSEYYGSNKYNVDGGGNYATGWALVYFLRTGAKNAKNWNPAWESILDTYLRVLVETDDLEKAVDQAFAGVDWEEFEDSWKKYTK